MQGHQELQGGGQALALVGQAVAGHTRLLAAAGHARLLAASTRGTTRRDAPRGLGCCRRSARCTRTWPTPGTAACPTPCPSTEGCRSRRHTATCTAPGDGVGRGCARRRRSHCGACHSHEAHGRDPLQHRRGVHGPGGQAQRVGWLHAQCQGRPRRQQHRRCRHCGCGRCCCRHGAGRCGGRRAGLMPDARSATRVLHAARVRAGRCYSRAGGVLPRRRGNARRSPPAAALHGRRNWPGTAAVDHATWRHRHEVPGSAGGRKESRAGDGRHRQRGRARSRLAVRAMREKGQAARRQWRAPEFSSGANEARPAPATPPPRHTPDREAPPGMA